MPLRNSILFAFHYQEQKLTIYTRWQDMSTKEQEEFCFRWNEDAYRPYREKQFARIIIEEAEQSLEKLEKLMPKKAGVSQDKEESMEVRTEKNIAFSKESEQNAFLQPVLERGKQQELKKLEQKWQRISQKFSEIESNASRKREKFREVCLDFLRELQLFRRKPLSTFAQRPDILLNEIVEIWNGKWPVKLPEVLKPLLATLQAREKEIEQGKNSCTNCDYLLKQGSIEQVKLELARLEKILERILQMRPIYSELLELLENSRSDFRHYQKSTFLIYDGQMAAFDFPRALQWKFIDDHLGAGPKASTENVESQIFAWLLRIMLTIFGIFMPLHVLLIVFCYWKGYGKSEIH